MTVTPTDCILGFNVRTDPRSPVEERASLDFVWDRLQRPPPPLPVSVRLIRCVPCGVPFMSADDLRESFAVVRDHLALRLGGDVDGGQIAWSFRQEEGLPDAGASIRIELTGR